MQFQRPVMRQEQRQKMTLQLIQSINLLPLTITELKQKIEEELENNPALEAVEDDKQVSFDELDTSRPEEAAYFEESSDSGFVQRAYSDDEDPQRRFLEGALSRGENLHEHLLWQLRLQKLDPLEFEVGELLINNLDENGFHLEAPESLFPEQEKKDVVSSALTIIQGFEPIGCATRDWKESLIVQMKMKYFPEEAERLITEFWDLLERKKTREIAVKLRVSEEEVKELIEDLKELTPFPGRAYSQEPPSYVVPDASIAMKDGLLKLVLNEEEIPILRIESSFQEGVFDLNGQKKEARQFMKQKTLEAERFIQNLRFRKNTLFKVCRAIMEFQVDFFRRGPKFLRPLTLKDVATELEINESTVSRVTTGKYVQTEWGIYELKYFFSNAVSSSQYSKEGVKEIIKELLQENKGGKKLSDQKVSDLLSQRGIEIARRTVTKYRKELSDAEN